MMHAFTTWTESMSQKRPISVRKGNVALLIPSTILKLGEVERQVASAAAAKFSQLQNARHHILDGGHKWKQKKKTVDTIQD